jgi:hypothetical protein
MVAISWLSLLLLMLSAEGNQILFAEIRMLRLKPLQKGAIVASGAYVMLLLPIPRVRGHTSQKHPSKMRMGNGDGHFLGLHLLWRDEKMSPSWRAAAKRSSSIKY